MSRLDRPCKILYKLQSYSFSQSKVLYSRARTPGHSYYLHGVTTMEKTFDCTVSSEVDPLSLALVHQPGYEHRQTIPWNKDSLLFDDILDVEEARPEHKRFTQLLSLHGVKVLYLMDLLKDIGRDDDDLRRLLAASTPSESHVSLQGVKVKPSDLICGLPIDYDSSSLRSLEPLPNLYFTRDSFFCVPGAIVISRPARAARRRESLLLAAIFEHHDLFQSALLYRGLLEDPEATLEGGDILVASPTTVLIGIGERTNVKGADNLIRFLFSQTSVERVGKIFNPPRRDFMHLDTILSFVDHKRVLTLPYLWSEPELYVNVAAHCRRRSEELGEPYSGPLPDAFSQRCRLEITEKAENSPRVYDDVLQGLDKEGIIEYSKTVYVGGPMHHYRHKEEHIIEGLREQWNDGANVLALKPGQVVAYSRNDRTFRALEEEGIEVVSFSGGELVRGRGGPRAMANPLCRE